MHEGRKYYIYDRFYIMLFPCYTVAPDIFTYFVSVYNLCISFCVDTCVFVHYTHSLCGYLLKLFYL